MIQLIPITIGIIGHLDAIITDRHKALISGLLEDLAVRYPHSPISLFSQLAPGADMFVAELFLEIKEKSDRPYELIVPLPYELDSFKASFKIDADKQRFDRALVRADRYFVLPVGDATDEESLYRNGGRFIADSSIILIAIWENQFNEKVGGTGDIVNYKRKGSFDGENVEKIFDQEGHVVSLNCNRQNDKAPQSYELPATLRESINMNVALLKALEKIEQLNKGAMKVSEKAIRSSGDYLYKKDAPTAMAERLKTYYSLIDMQAINGQKWYKRGLNSLFIMGFIIILAFECYKHLEQPLTLLIITASAFLIAFLINILSHGKEFHSRYLEDRVLAEALRIQFFWDLGNIRENVADHLLRIHKIEFNWLKHILLALRGVTYDETLSEIYSADLMNFWVRDQEQYFTKKIKESRQSKNWYETLSRVALFVAICLIVLLFIPYYYYPDDVHERAHYLHPMIVAIGTLLGIFGLSKAYVEKRGYHQTINQYSLMKEIYTAAAKKLTEMDGELDKEMQREEKRRKIYYLAGKEALIENGNWYMIYKDKELYVEGIGG